MYLLTASARSSCLPAPETGLMMKWIFFSEGGLINGSFSTKVQKKEKTPQRRLFSQNDK